MIDSMSLGIVFKGAEGIVLAADSRVTLYNQKPSLIPNQTISVPSYYDNAQKLLYCNSQTHIGAVTYGLGALGQKDFRTAHSLMLEFEDYLGAKGVTKKKRIKVQEYAKHLSDFFLDQWNTRMPPQQPNAKIDPMIFLVGGYNEGEIYGKIYQFSIPLSPVPTDCMADDTFGLQYGGQSDYLARLLRGFDNNLPIKVKEILNINDAQKADLTTKLTASLSSPVPYQFFSLQDCVDLSTFLITTTIRLQLFLNDIRGVGGEIDVATITRAEGFQPVQVKQVHGNYYQI